MSIDEMARIIEAEASVLDFQGKLAVAQCICDNRFDANVFTHPADNYSAESLLAARLAIEDGARRYYNAKILQFRSFTQYDDPPDWQKIYASVPHDLMYIGEDHRENYGHYYFGRYTHMSKPFRLLLIAGHGRNVDGTYDPGAIGCGYREADLNRELVRILKQRADENGVPCDVAADRNYFSWFKYGNTYDFTPYSYVLEVHFNATGKDGSMPDGVMIGSLMFVDQSETGVSVEEGILRNLYAIGGKKAWDGVVTTQRNYPTGLMVQSRVRAQGVSHAVLETAFITDADDVKWYQDNKQLIATQVIKGIITGFGLDKSKKTPYAYVGKGIATAEANEDMNVRTGTNIQSPIIGIVKKGQRVEVLETFQTGWMKIVWPGADCGYAYTSNVNNHYYKIV